MTARRWSRPEPEPEVRAAAIEVAPAFQFGPTGHFSRPDILRLAPGPWEATAG
ncbi:MAG: hypothetical protein M3O23_05755 [Actinomycetota bacterium]|nr:hypothetical protein [Actinomycetota bacterium]